MLEDGKIFIGKSTKPEYLDLRLANRHGLITGATGTGKTVSLQVLAEGFSNAGVPVFAADIKGDLSGMAAPGNGKEPLVKRAQEIGVEYVPDKFPVVFWDTEGVGKDVRRANDFVASGNARTAYAVFVDEGGAFRHRDAHPGSIWIDWEVEGAGWLRTSVLWTRVRVGETAAEMATPPHESVSDSPESASREPAEDEATTLNPGDDGVVEFRHDDAGYERWRTAHSRGFVVNAGGSLKLHLATCPYISDPQWKGSGWTTGQYRKVCSTSRDELKRWAEGKGKKLEECGAQSCFGS